MRFVRILLGSKIDIACDLHNRHFATTEASYKFLHCEREDGKSQKQRKKSATNCVCCSLFVVRHLDWSLEVIVAQEKFFTGRVSLLEPFSRWSFFRLSSTMAMFHKDVLHYNFKLNLFVIILKTTSLITQINYNKL